MEERRFISTFGRLRFLVGGVWFLALIGFVLFAFSRYGPSWLAIVWGIAGFVFMIQQALWFTLAAREVTVCGDHIEGITYSNRRVILAWEGVSQISRFDLAVLGGRLHVVRLVPEDSSRGLIITSQMASFDSLVELIARHATRARDLGRRSPWEQFLRF